MLDLVSTWTKSEFYIGMLSWIALGPRIEKSLDLYTRKSRLYTSASRAVITCTKRNLHIPDFLVKYVFIEMYIF